MDLEEDSEEAESQGSEEQEEDSEDSEESSEGAERGAPSQSLAVVGEAQDAKGVELLQRLWQREEKERATAGFLFSRCRSPRRLQRCSGCGDRSFDGGPRGQAPLDTN